MLALIGNLDFFEIVLILVVSVVVFGDRLPEVAMRAAAHLVKLRRTVMQMWREAGLEDELRRVQRDIDLDIKKLPTPREYIEQKAESLTDLDFEEDVDDPADPDPDAGRAEDGDPSYAREGLDNEPHLVVDPPDGGGHSGADRREPLAEADAEPAEGDHGDGPDADAGARNPGDDPGRETA